MDYGNLLGFFLFVCFYEGESVEIPKYNGKRLNQRKRKLLDILTKNRTFNFQINTRDIFRDDNVLKENLHS